MQTIQIRVCLLPDLARKLLDSGLVPQSVNPIPTQTRVLVKGWEMGGRKNIFIGEAISALYSCNLKLQTFWFWKGADGKSLWLAVDISEEKSSGIPEMVGYVLRRQLVEYRHLAEVFAVKEQPELTVLRLTGSSNRLDCPVKKRAYLDMHVIDGQIVLSHRG